MHHQERIWGLLADGILVLHVGVVAFLVGGLALIWLGAARRWTWIHSRTFRLLHLGAMGFILMETVIGLICPLTEWEAALRARAGQETYGDATFIQYWLQQLLYWDWSRNTFILLYLAFFMLIVWTHIAVPPASKTKRPNRIKR